MRNGSICWGLASALLFCTPAQAQSPCELHVIPTATFAVIDNTQSWVTQGGGGLAGSMMGGLMAIKNPKAIEELLASSFPTDQQNAILGSLDLQKLLKIANYTIIYHDLIEDVKAKEIMKNESMKLSKRVKENFKHMQFGPRLTSSTAACYAELRVNSIYYEKMPLSKKLYAVFVFRKFGIDPKPSFAAIRQAGESLNDFPPKSESEMEAAKVQLRSGFAKTLGAFAAKMIK